nr:leucine-rich repeat protein [Tanacetum cinerariifolium]
MSTGCSKQEQRTLLKFKNTLDDSYGLLSSWVGNDCCSWIGVRCDDTMGSTHVVGLHVKGNNSHSDIPLFPEDSPFNERFISSYDFNSSLAELWHLKYLKFLDLSGNYLDGEIPEFTGSLKQLSHLNLSNSGFTGNIPHHIGNLSNLKVLDLSASDLQLAADDMAWVSGLTSLERLVLTDVDLSKARNRSMVLYMIPSLKELSLSGCGVPLSDLGPHYDLSKTLPNLQHLELSGNAVARNLQSEFDIPVPESLESLGKLANLRVLHLASNRLMGPIPESLGRLRLLEVLDLSSNQLSGPIPTFLGQLTILNLSKNQLNGSIPESLGGLINLTDLLLQSNQLTGSIPSSLGKLASLKTFSVSSNMLGGVIPTSIGQFSKLVSLDVSNNSLEGVVSEAHFANHLMLEYLDISFNRKLTFNVSREWIPPFQLRTVHISSCKILGKFPQWLKTQLNLDELVMSNANISGPLPTWFQEMPVIPTLDLSHNKITGPLTNLPVGVYSKYGSLLLQDNLFRGSIPVSLCNRTDLLVLDLSKNRLTGKIPECFGNFSLRVMILSSNELSGTVPSSYSDYDAVWLQLNENYFTGELPEGLWNNSFLRVLDVGNNEFSGEIPEWDNGFSNLKVLRLHRNNFTGSIPSSLCNRQSLHILDVAYNNLTGSIPRCFGELSSMADASLLGDDLDRGLEASVIQVLKGVYLEYSSILQYLINMDLSSNRLMGEIPQELTKLSLLVGLNLSNNHLSGGIPNRIGGLKALNSLDFSKNQLTGKVPASMASLTFLSHLNLSYNNLSGRIPTGNQLQTFTDPSIYAGNSGLCGAPLPKDCTNPKDPTTTTTTTTTRSKSKSESNDKPDVWFYLVILCGLAIGFWGVIGFLLFKKQWRHKFFMFVDVTMDKIHVAIARNVYKIQKGR